MSTIVTRDTVFQHLYSRTHKHKFRLVKGIYKRREGKFLDFRCITCGHQHLYDRDLFYDNLYRGFFARRWQMIKHPIFGRGGKRPLKEFA